MTEDTAGRYEILIDGLVRSSRDVKRFALEAAQYLRRRNPHSKVEVRDSETGKIVT
jgi:hypothetical protein